MGGQRAVALAPAASVKMLDEEVVPGLRCGQKFLDGHNRKSHMCQGTTADLATGLWFQKPLVTCRDNVERRRAVRMAESQCQVFCYHEEPGLCRS